MTEIEKFEGFRSLTLHSDRVELPDGRYLIYYTFEAAESKNDQTAVTDAACDPNENFEN